MKLNHWSEDLEDEFRKLNYKFFIRDRGSHGECKYAGVNSKKEIFSFLNERYPSIEKVRIGFNPQDEDFTSFIIMEYKDNGEFWVKGYLKVLKKD